jgi:hypothetical protein
VTVVTKNRVFYYTIAYCMPFCIGIHPTASFTMNASEISSISSETSISSSEWPPSPTPPARHIPPPIRRVRRQHASRDQRLQVKTLTSAGLKQREIAHQLNMTRNQVQYAQQHPSTPIKRKGRPSILSNTEIERIIEWVCASHINRRCQWERIP